MRFLILLFIFSEEATFAFKRGRIAGGTRERRGVNAGEVQNAIKCVILY
jgi:hypothetical protein